MSVCVCVRMWRLEADFWCLHLWMSILSFETGHLTETLQYQPFFFPFKNPFRVKVVNESVLVIFIIFVRQLRLLKLQFHDSTVYASERG